LSTWYADTDGDGFGDAAVTRDAYGQPVNYVSDDRIDEGLVAANISSFTSSVAAGGSVDIDYDTTTNSGLTDFEVEVLINNRRRLHHPHPRRHHRAILHT
jgi:hypothetical protein